MPKKDYVGYKNPPKDTQFKKGQSGNPKGRPPNRHRDCEDRFRGIILDDANEKITLTINGKKEEMSSFKAAIKALKLKAVSGQISAAKEYFKIIEHTQIERQKSIETQFDNLLHIEHCIDNLDDEAFFERFQATKPMVRILINQIFKRINDI